MGNNRLEEKHRELFGWTPRREEFGCTTEQYKKALAEAVKTNVNAFDVLEKLFGISHDSMHGRNGKVIFEIDVVESMRKSLMEGDRFSTEDIEDILDGMNPFKVTYTLTRNNGLERYEIKDSDGNKHGCNEYNSYQRGIFGECYDYFSHYLFYMEEKKELPSGVVGVTVEKGW